MTLEEISPQAFQDGTYNQAALHNSLEEGCSEASAAATIVSGAVAGVGKQLRE